MCRPGTKGSLLKREILRHPAGRDHHDAQERAPLAGMVMAPGYALRHHHPSQILILIADGFSP
jgi:hypothetical protein